MTDRTPTRGLRDRLAKAIRKGAATSDIRPSYRVADAVLPVVEDETAALRARAERAEAALRDLTDDRAWRRLARYDDPETTQPDPDPGDTRHDTRVAPDAITGGLKEES